MNTSRSSYPDRLCSFDPVTNTHTHKLLFRKTLLSVEGIIALFVATVEDDERAEATVFEWADGQVLSTSNARRYDSLDPRLNVVKSCFSVSFSPKSLNRSR